MSSNIPGIASDVVTVRVEDVADVEGGPMTRRVADAFVSVVDRLVVTPHSAVDRRVEEPRHGSFDAGRSQFYGVTVPSKPVQKGSQVFRN